MKILMISPQPFFEPRGTPISVYQRLEALSGLGHEIDLVTYHLGTDVEFPRVHIHRVRKIQRIHHVRIGPSRAKLLLDALVFLKALRMLLGKHYDVIHSHEEASFFSMFLAWVFRTRHLYDMHSVLSRQLAHFSFGNKSIFIKIFGVLETMVLKTCDAVITVGPDIEKYARAAGSGVRVAVIENIALQAYQTAVQPEEVEELKTRLDLGGRLLIVYAGTYENYQGLRMALGSVGRVAKEYPSVIFIFVGATNQQAREWTEIAHELNVQQHVLFLDAVSPAESMVYLASATVLISPRLEGTTTPLKIYSYLHANRPIVATDITAHTQLLNHETAILVRPNVHDFAEGILRVLRDPELAERIADTAHEFAQAKLGYQDYISKVSQIYQSLASASVAEKHAFSWKE
jgi:glycosyltransferase involved in cell wall biosynthesis